MRKTWLLKPDDFAAPLSNRAVLFAGAAWASVGVFSVLGLRIFAFHFGAVAAFATLYVVIYYVVYLVCVHRQSPGSADVAETNGGER